MAPARHGHAGQTPRGSHRWLPSACREGGKCRPVTKARPRRADSTGGAIVGYPTRAGEAATAARRYPRGSKDASSGCRGGQVRTAEAAPVPSSEVGHTAQGANQRTGRWATDSNRADAPEGDGLEPCRRASEGKGPTMNEGRVQRTQEVGSPNKWTAAAKQTRGGKPQRTMQTRIYRNS